MVVLTGKDHLVGFIMVGAKALALEDALLSSVELKGDIDTSDENGWLSWQGARFSVAYPKDYAVMDSGTAVMFGDPNGSGNLIAVRAYDLNVEYSDNIAPAVAAAYLPKSTHIGAEPEMVTMGGRNAAVIRGDVNGKALAFYIVGRGRTALGIMLMGETAVEMAENIVMSAEITF